MVKMYPYYKYKMPRTQKIYSRNPLTRQNYCIDVFGDTLGENSLTTAFPCNKRPSQNFAYNRKTKQIQNKFSNKCLDLERMRPIVQRTCNPKSKTQKWTRNKKHWKSAYDKRCLDVEAGKYDNGRLISYKCNKGFNQRFSA
jgi:hypothetical protein